MRGEFGIWRCHQNCTARLNGNGGISGGNASIISGCTTVSNVNNGIVVGNGASVSQCTISGNLNGILTGTGCLILACASSLNSSNGVLAGDGSSIKNCTLAQNAASGVRATNNCLIAGNAGSYNALGLTTAASVYITGSDNEIVDNNVTHSGRGIKADSGFNLIVKNKATINDMDFDLVTGNKTGAISNDPTTAGPWANFSF